MQYRSKVSKIAITTRLAMLNTPFPLPPKGTIVFEPSVSQGRAASRVRSLETQNKMR